MKTILVVDDEFGSTEALVMILEQQGHRVFGAANGRQALAQHAAQPADLVIADLMMPVMDGAELVRRLRAAEHAAGSARLPVLMTSGLAEEVVRARAPQIDAFLRKPFAIATLLAMVARLLAVEPP